MKSADALRVTAPVLPLMVERRGVSAGQRIAYRIALGAGGGGGIDDGGGGGVLGDREPLAPEVITGAALGGVMFSVSVLLSVCVPPEPELPPSLEPRLSVTVPVPAPPPWCSSPCWRQ